MIRFRKYNDINYFSYFSITNYVALLCGLVTFIVPMYNNHNSNTMYTLLNVFQLSFTSINIMAICVILVLLLVFISNMFFQPSWGIYFIDVALIIYLFVSPVLINSQLLPLLNLHNSSLTLSTGSILLMISAMLFIAIEIYKVSVMDVFVNRNIKEKKQKKLQRFINTRHFKAIKQKQAKRLQKQKDNSKPKNIKIKVKQSKIKANKKMQRTHLLKTDDYRKQLDFIYKI